MKSNSLILLSVGFFLAVLAVVFYAAKTNEQHPYQQSSVVSEQYLSTSSQELSMRKIHNQLRLLLTEIDDMKSEIEELKSLDNSLGVDDRLLNSNSSGAEYLSKLYQQIQQDPTKRANVKGYFQDIKEQQKVLNVKFFDDQELDNDWSTEAVSYMENSLYNDNTLANSGAQLSNSECKVGICKVTFNIPVSEGSTIFDKNILEHNLLVSISEKFPRGKLNTQTVGSDLVIQGFVMDENTSLPKVDHIFSDGKVTPDEMERIQSILGQ